MEGSAGSSGTTYVDVRDVARAHVLAAEVPSAQGRYILSHTHAADAAEIAKWLQVPPSGSLTDPKNFQGVGTS